MELVEGEDLIAPASGVHECALVTADVALRRVSGVPRRPLPAADAPPDAPRNLLT